MSLTLSVAPSAEPVSLAQAKRHLRLLHDEDNLYLFDSDNNTGLIPAARGWLEQQTGRQLIDATWQLKLRGWPAGPILVPRPPLSSVTSITYTDTGGTSQTWDSANYTVNTDAQPGEIEPAYNESYPDVRDVPNNVVVTFVAGYGTSGNDIPEDLQHAMLLLIDHWYHLRAPASEQTFSQIPFTVESLIETYVVRDERLFDFV